MTDVFMARVAAAQAAIKAPKGQYNSFGKYAYRSCEDILEAAKPVCVSHGLLLTVSDEMVVIGERYYVRATATLRDTESDAKVYSTAYAREPLDKKGMDESQITGAASSYARKYALNGLLCIDDTKDADTDEYAAATKRDTRTRDEVLADKRKELAAQKWECGDCGAEMTDKNTSISKSGEPLERMRQVEATIERFGRPLCGACVDKRKAGAEIKA